MLTMQPNPASVYGRRLSYALDFLAHDEQPAKLRPLSFRQAVVLSGNATSSAWRQCRGDNSVRHSPGCLEITQLGIRKPGRLYQAARNKIISIELDVCSVRDRLADLSPPISTAQIIATGSLHAYLWRQAAFTRA